MGKLKQLIRPTEHRWNEKETDVSVHIKNMAGNMPGAITVMANILKNHGPNNANEIYKKMDKMGMYEGNIWNGFELCDQDFLKFSKEVMSEDISGIKSTINPDGAMKTDFFNKEIKLEIPSLKNSPLETFWKEKNIDIPLSVLAGQIVKETRELGGPRIELDEASYNFTGNWMATNPKDVLLAHLAYEMNTIKDYDLNIEGFLGRVMGTLQTAFPSTTAEIYGISEDVTLHITEYENSMSNDLSSGMKP